VSHPFHSGFGVYRQVLEPRTPVASLDSVDPAQANRPSDPTLEERKRLAHRLEYAEEWLSQIRESCLALSRETLPQSALGQAVAYTLNMWAKLRRCFDYAEVELSNNLAENSMRPVALGRKNWLHVGSAQAGPKVAAILSVTESCRRLNVPVKDYLAVVLPGLNRRTLSEVAHLAPARWSAARG